MGLVNADITLRNPRRPDLEPVTVAALAVLREIRDQLKGTNQRLDRLELRVGALEQHQTETEVHLASELVAVAKAVTEVRDLLRDHLDLRDRFDDHERRLSALERRVVS